MSKAIYEKLTAPFGPEALSKDISRGSGNPFTSIKAQYMIERLNEVFGVDGWNSEYVQTVTPEGVLCKCILTVNIDGKTFKREAFGGAEFKMKNGREKLLGDVVKSAMTDSLGKAASHIGVGNDVFKGLVAPPGGSGYASKPAAAKPKATVTKTTGGFNTKASAGAPKTTKKRSL